MAQINGPVLRDPAARVILDTATCTRARRQSAACTGSAHGQHPPQPLLGMQYIIPGKPGGPPATLGPATQRPSRSRATVHPAAAPRGLHAFALTSLAVLRAAPVAEAHPSARSSAHAHGRVTVAASGSTSASPAQLRNRRCSPHWFCLHSLLGVLYVIMV